MRVAFSTVLVLFVLLSTPNSSAQGGAQSKSGNGLTVQEFRDFAKNLPDLPGRIEAIRLFQGLRQKEVFIAVATWGRQPGWQLFVFDSTAGVKFHLDWKSGKLDDSFSVSDAGALKVFGFALEQGVEFAGCAPHACPEVFSVLLYVPSKRTAFTAKSVYGKVTYSPGVEASENAPYKAALDQLIREHS